jgi:hypothetical protein
MSMIKTQKLVLILQSDGDGHTEPTTICSELRHTQ